MHGGTFLRERAAGGGAVSEGDGGPEDGARAGEFDAFAGGHVHGLARVEVSPLRCRGAGGGEDDLGGGDGEVDGGGAFGPLRSGEPEVVHGGLVQFLAGLGRLGAQDVGGGRVEADDAEEFGDVDVLGGEAAAQHVVGAGHDLDAEALDVGVGHAGAEEEGFAGLEPYVVEEQGGDDAGVARVVVCEVGVRGEVAARAGAGGGGGGDGVGHRVGVGGEDGGEDLAECGVLGVGAQDVDVRLEGVDVEGGEEVGGLGGRAEAAESLEGVRAQMSSGLWWGSL